MSGLINEDDFHDGYFDNAMDQDIHIGDMMVHDMIHDVAISQDGKVTISVGSSDIERIHIKGKRIIVGNIECRDNHAYIKADSPGDGHTEHWIDISQTIQLLREENKKLRQKLSSIEHRLTQLECLPPTQGGAIYQEAKKEWDSVV